DSFVAPVQAIALSADEGQLSAAGRNGEVRVWRRDADRWKAARVFRRTPAAQWAFLSPNGELAGYLDGPVIEVWDLAKETMLRAFATEPAWLFRNGAFDMTNRRLIGGFKNEQANTVGWALWNLDTGERVRLSEMPSLGNTYANGVDFSQDGRRLAIGF